MKIITSTSFINQILFRQPPKIKREIIILFSGWWKFLVFPIFTTQHYGLIFLEESCRDVYIYCSQFFWNFYPDYFQKLVKGNANLLMHLNAQKGWIANITIFATYIKWATWRHVFGNTSKKWDCIQMGHSFILPE